MENQNIDELIKIYARREATPEQREIVKQAILDDTDLFVNLLVAMRHESMKALNLDIDKDFLPDHLRRCAPAAFDSCRAFSFVQSDSLSASMMPSAAEQDIFQYLCNELLDK